MHRRTLLRSTARLATGLAAGPLLAGCRTVAPAAPPSAAAPARPRTLAPVRVSPDRVIRTIAGLRPFRASGFRVEAERLDDRTVVHNYGHGGCGVTLSWGTAEQAADLAMATGAARVAVLGCGAVGLATARTLQQRGVAVTIYARELPPDTTSNVAGATFYPSFVAAASRRTAAFDAQYERAMRRSHRVFQELVGERYGVRWIEEYWLSERPLPVGRDREPILDLFPETGPLAPGTHPFTAPSVGHDVTMLIEPPVYLRAVLEDVLLAGGRVVVRELATRADVAALPETTVVNCTGLGARALFGDPELEPIRGQLVVLLPQPEVDYVVAQDDLYMFPRRDGILLGGTYERGEWSTAPDAAARDRVLAGHARLFASMRGG